MSDISFIPLSRLRFDAQRCFDYASKRLLSQYRIYEYDRLHHSMPAKPKSVTRKGRKPKDAKLISMKFPSQLLTRVDRAAKKLKIDRTAWLTLAAEQMLAMPRARDEGSE
jgi:hypothetical protein